MSLHYLLDKVFGKAEEINGRFRCPTYLYRWIVWKKTKNLKIYLHHFVGDDWSLDLHDHPKRFISIGLWGWYVEQTPGDSEAHRIKKYNAPWIRSFPANHIHRLLVPSKNCWTLVIVLKPVRDWGFWHKGQFIPFLDYVDGKDSSIADKMKSC